MTMNRTLRRKTLLTTSSQTKMLLRSSMKARWVVKTLEIWTFLSHPLKRGRRSKWSGTRFSASEQAAETTAWTTWMDILRIRWRRSSSSSRSSWGRSSRRRIILRRTLSRVEIQVEDQAGVESKLKRSLWKNFTTMNTVRVSHRRIVHRNCS
jgi:hypothetical protein